MEEKTLNKLVGLAFIGISMFVWLVFATQDREENIPQLEAQEEIQENDETEEEVSKDIEESQYMKLVEPTKISATKRHYNIKNLKLRFDIPTKFEKFLVFSPINKQFEIIQIQAETTPQQAYENSLGDGGEATTYIQTYPNLENKSLEDFIEEYKNMGGVISDSIIEIDSQKSAKIVYTSFGSKKITHIVTIIGNTVHEFHAHENNSELLQEIINSTIFSDKKPTLKEYLSEIPDEFFMGVSKEDRLSNIEILDEKNYYVKFNPSSWDGNGSMTVFIDPNGEHIIATEMKGCGPMCQQEFHLLKKVDGQYIEITDEIFPKPDFSEQIKKSRLEDTPFVPLVIIPRHGTTVEIRDQVSQKLLAKFKWKNGEFTLINN